MAKISSSIISKLEDFLDRQNVSTSEDDLESHSKDWSFHKKSLPDLVVWPQTTKQVSKVLQIALENNIPVVARGGGSSLEGNPIPVNGGIVLDMTKMNKILQVFDKDLQVRVQPGIVGDELNKKLAKYNLFFPAAPGSSYVATVGGMIANNAGGMYAIKYGVVGDWVLELEVVLADGKIIRIGGRTFKSVSGYDLKSIFIGSEGTLGIITEAVLKLTPIPKSKIAMMVSFSTNKKAVSATLDILRSDCAPAAVEFMDSIYMSCVNKVKDTDFSEKPTLVVELHADKNVIDIQMKKLKKILKSHGNASLMQFKTLSEVKLLWDYRRAVRPALKQIMPGVGVLSAEVAVPISGVEDFLKKASNLSAKFGLQTIMFGHIGDGNFHGWALYKLDDSESLKKVTKLNEELVEFAISLSGTTTGEHGVGIGKRKFLLIEHPTGLPVMKDLKKMFDSKGILNPGKIFI